MKLHENYLHGTEKGKKSKHYQGGIAFVYSTPF